MKMKLPSQEEQRLTELHYRKRGIEDELKADLPLRNGRLCFIHYAELMEQLREVHAEMASIVNFAEW